jgi:hypothetical protein
MATVKAEINSWPEVSFEEISLKPVCELERDANPKYEILAKSTRCAQSAALSPHISCRVQATLIFSCPTVNMTSSDLDWRP